jgi:hypothetical protein
VKALSPLRYASAIQIRNRRAEEWVAVDGRGEFDVVVKAAEGHRTPRRWRAV